MVNINIHIPWKRTAMHLDTAVRRGIAPELYFDGEDMTVTDDRAVMKVAALLERSELKPSIHAPFLDINIAATDPDVAAITGKRLLRAIDFARILNATGIVVHPGFDPFRFRGAENKWLESAQKNIEGVVRTAERYKMPLAVENIFDETCLYLKQLIEFFDSPFLGHCFDTGHFNIFVTMPLSEWLQETGEKTFALHIHDNFGRLDQHLPVGEGSFPFSFFVENLPRNLKWITMEMHDESDALRCLSNWESLTR